MIPWASYLRILVLLAIAGFALVIVRGFWPILVLLIIAAILILIWRNSHSNRR